MTKSVKKSKIIILILIFFVSATVMALCQMLVHYIYDVNTNEPIAMVKSSSACVKSWLSYHTKKIPTREEYKDATDDCRKIAMRKAEGLKY